MRINVVCDYCRCTDKRTYYLITLTSITDRSNSCTKVICDKCTYHIQTLLDRILDKRDIDETLKEIENDMLGDEE